MTDRLARITCNPKILAGKPIIRGMRISVELILEMLANGRSIEQLLEDYPILEKEDILAAIEYAAKTIRNEKILIKTA